VNELIGQEWNSYKIVGVMNNWPALYSMGYYSDVVYVPIDAIPPSANEYPLVGQIPFHIPEELDFEATIELMRQAIMGHRNAWSDDLESKPQVILPITQLADLMIWRGRFHMVLGVFAGFSFLVGSVGVMNFVFVWVVSRWREIGIRRAVGASRGAIFRLVLCQAITLNLKSGVFGGLAGTLAGILVQISNAWPVVVYPYWIAVAIVAGLLATLIFGGLPALWASYRPPIESLRME
jgi:putative ABC transport system permease protein